MRISIIYRSPPCWPMSTYQVVQEYERAVIFRLGRLKKGAVHQKRKLSHNFTENFLTHLNKDLKHIFLKNILSLSGGASGPGLFFILPCIDKYDCIRKVDFYRKHDLERSSFNIRSWQNHIFVLSREFVVLFILLWDEFPKCLSKLWRVTFKMPPYPPGIHVSTWGRFPMR